VDRRFAWLGGAVGAFAVFRWLKRGRKSQEISMERDGDPAAELRAKLEESRAVADEQHEAAAEPETTVDAAPDPESRRRDVHEAARARIDELKESGSDEGADA
jgi:hypothetical protein